MWTAWAGQRWNGSLIMLSSLCEETLPTSISLVGFHPLTTVCNSRSWASNPAMGFGSQDGHYNMIHATHVQWSANMLPLCTNFVLGFSWFEPLGVNEEKTVYKDILHNNLLPTWCQHLGPFPVTTWQCHPGQSQVQKEMVFTNWCRRTRLACTEPWA